MNKVFLRDNLPINDKIRVDDFGFLHIDDVTIARTGVQYYLESELFENGRNVKVGVARLKEDVLSENSIKTFKNIPLTDDHPKEFVTPKNFSKYQKGSIAIVKSDKDYLKTDLTVNDESLIKKVQNGKVELSVGYFALLEEEEGEINGEKYKYKQTDIIANHLAIVQYGRCGSKCSLLGDDGSLILNKRQNMKKIKIGETEFEVDDKVAEYINGLVAEKEVLTKELSKSKDNEKKALGDAIALVNEKKALLDFASDKKIEVDKALEIHDTKVAIVKGLGFTVDGQDESYLDGVISASKIHGAKVVDEKKKINDKKLPNKTTSAWNDLKTGDE